MNKPQAPENWIPQVGENVYHIDHFGIYASGPFEVEKITPKGSVRVRYNESKGGTGLFKLGHKPGIYESINRGRVNTWSHIVPESAIKGKS